jgi:TorA maturation chaperone TorD/Pyruvate/2-oxoacid:ferredoxin oxidoreductase delta subunit
MMANSPASRDDGRAALYLSLAEALGEPPEWLAEAGRCWPLSAQARRLAGDSPAAAQGAVALAQVEAEPLALRCQRYSSLFAGTGGSPRFWLYESMHRSGRLLGKETAAVGRLYQAAGLQAGTAELADNASVELAFLAYLAGQAAADGGNRRQWRALERRFIRQHAGCWLPALGRALARDGDAVYGPIGQLLAAWLGEAAQPAKNASRSQSKRPHMVAAEECILCGFCVQACPRRALRVEERDKATRLLFLAAACTGCRQCQQICPSEVLAFGHEEYPAGWVVWRESARQFCPGCGQPTVSQAELDFVRLQVGEAAWQVYCPDCRQ